MAKYLVIVESPAKVKTIKKFLGANYEVMASQGHVRDLPKSQLGFDPEHDYEPKYITIRGKGDLLASLRKEVKKADKIYLATDPDREGEAISWHLYYALKSISYYLQGDHQERGKGISEKRQRDRYESGGCPAGKTYAGPYGGLSDLPTSVGKDQERLKRRPCTVCGTPYHL